MEEGSHVQLTSNKEIKMPCGEHINNDDKANGQELERMQLGDEVEKPVVGMIFRSEEEVRSFYNNYAKSQGFGVIKVSEKNGSDGKSRYFSLACARYGKPISTAKNSFHPRPLTKTNCKAKINVTAKDDGRFIIARIYLDHNHALSPGKVRHFKCNKVLDPHAKRKLELNDLAGIKLSKNFHSLVVEAGGYENLPYGEKECRNYIAKARQLRLGIGDVEALRSYFFCMQKRNSNFFYVIDMDDEGRLRNVFWADARCRAAYESFGDVITFDSTYLTNKYDMPFAPFVGVNHHGQSMLFGCGLLSNEDTNTYTWLFESWLTCMQGCAPKAIVTDQCKAIQAAVAKVFTNSYHRLCLWHIMQKLPMKLGGLSQYKVIKKTLKSIVYESIKPDEFERSWMEMINEYKLENNEWLKSLYGDRHRWVPVFVKSTFWAGMSTTQRSESMNAFFDGYVHSKTTLKQFVEQYDNALKSKIEKEIKADYASFNTTIPAITKFSIESQFQKIYTNDIFKLFQDELRGLIYCNISSIKREGSMSTFVVTESVIGKDGICWKEVDYEVIYIQTKCTVQCLCHLFEFRGILCKHAISVMIKEKVNEVPCHYILERWRKDIKRGYTFVKNAYDDVSNSEQRLRNNKLNPLFHELQELGAYSDDNCELLLELLKETKEKLLAMGSNCESGQTNQVLSIPAVECNNKLHEIPSVDSRLLTPLKARAKGRPPSKRKESIVGKIIKKRKKVSQRTNREPLGENDDSQVRKRKQVCESTPTFMNDVGSTTSHIVDKISTQESHMKTTPTHLWNDIYAGRVINYCNFADESAEMYSPHYMPMRNTFWQNHNFNHLLQNNERFSSNKSMDGCSFDSEKNLEPKITYEDSLGWIPTQKI